MVEALPGDWFAEGDGEIFAPLAEHLIGEQKHLNAKFYAQKFPDVGKPVKEVGVMAAHEDGDHIPFGFNRFLDKVFVPFQIRNDIASLPGGQTCRKNQHLLFRLVGCIDLID